MIHVLRIIVLSICIASAVTPRSDAQQAAPNGNTRKEQIEQLKQDILGIRQQLKPLRLQLQELLTQTQKLRAQMHPLEEKMNEDRLRVQYLLTKGK